jgi:aminoglycoside phosphotransferase (APT) family kinase protein
MSDLRGTLQEFIAERLTGAADLEVSEPRRLGGGSSQENWTFDAVWNQDGARHSAEMLLRREPASGVVDTARDVEFALLRAVGETEVPVAKVFWVDDGTVFGRPSMVVERCRGEAHRGVLRDTDPLGMGDSARRELAGSLVDLLARVHRVDVVETGLDGILPAVGDDPARAELERWEADLTRAELEPHPILRFVARWLRDHVPSPPARLSLVHGDFRPANVLIHNGQVEVLLDWELAHLGDPVDDLGWYTCSIYRLEHFPAGGWGIEEFLARYCVAAATPEVDLGRLHFWQVMSTFRLAIMALTGVRNFCDGSSDRPAAPVDRVVRQALADTEVRR